MHELFAREGEGRVTSPVLETQLMRLADSIAGYTEREAFVALNAQTPEAREEIRAALQDIVTRGKLRRSEGRHYRIRHD